MYPTINPTLRSIRVPRKRCVSYRVSFRQSFVLCKLILSGNIFCGNIWTARSLKESATRFYLGGGAQWSAELQKVKQFKFGSLKWCNAKMTIFEKCCHFEKCSISIISIYEAIAYFQSDMFIIDWLYQKCHLKCPFEQLNCFTF